MLLMVSWSYCTGGHQTGGCTRVGCLIHVWFHSRSSMLRASLVWPIQGLTKDGLQQLSADGWFCRVQWCHVGNWPSTGFGLALLLHQSAAPQCRQAHQGASFSCFMLCCAGADQRGPRLALGSTKHLFRPFLWFPARDGPWQDAFFHMWEIEATLQCHRTNDLEC